MTRTSKQIEANRQIVSAYNRANSALDEASCRLVHLPSYSHQVADQLQTLEALEAAVKQLRSAIEAARA